MFKLVYLQAYNTHTPTCMGEQRLASAAHAHPVKLSSKECGLQNNGFINFMLIYATTYTYCCYQTVFDCLPCIAVALLFLLLLMQQQKEQKVDASNL